MTELPALFIDSLKETLDDNNIEALCGALSGESPVSVRFNPYKLSEKPEGRQVPWCRYGFYLNERPVFTLDPSFHGGSYYVQEAGSMFIEHLYRETMGEQAGIKVLDLCAAPGGKTTLLSTVAGLENMIVANEVIRHRAGILAENVRKWGLGNVAVTNNDPSHFSEIKDYFDFIVVDAPCSGEGMFRKTPEAIEEWSPENVKLCAARQRRILSDIWDSLKPGGILVYSTCTFNRTENEENVQWLAENYDCEGVEINTDDSWGILRGEAGTSGDNDILPIPTFRFFPHKTASEGFFAAVIRKGGNSKGKPRFPKPRRAVFSELNKNLSKEAGNWVSQPEFMVFSGIGENIYGYYADQYEDIKRLSGVLSIIYSGVLMGQFFKNKLKPEHSLALFHDINRKMTPTAALDLDNALKYLRKQDIAVDLLCEGINLVTFEDLPIGWIKRIGARSNNLYPKESRIMNL